MTHVPHMPSTLTINTIFVISSLDVNNYYNYKFIIIKRGSRVLQTYLDHVTTTRLIGTMRDKKAFFSFSLDFDVNTKKNRAIRTYYANH